MGPPITIIFISCTKRLRLTCLHLRYLLITAAIATSEHNLGTIHIHNIYPHISH